MEKAKENYKSGEIRIVSAEQIKKQHGRTISSEEKRFFCLTCGEYVAYVNSVKKKSYFRHIKKTAETKECELRTEGQNKLFVYQKVGLPIYIKKNQNDKFSIHIGFYGIDKKDIQPLKNENIIISSSKDNKNFENKYFIDDINFNIENTTLKQINFICPKYKILYSSRKAHNTLNKIWGNEIEGINDNGAIFKYGENGGRKVRINEEITIDTDYYCISQDDNIFKGIFGIDSEEVGYISVKNGVYKVYKIRMIFNLWNRKELCEFFREYFKVDLVAKSSEIIPLWPPTIDTDKNIVLFYTQMKLLLLLKSVQPNPSLFIHRIDYFSNVDIEEIEHKKYAFTVFPISLERALNLGYEYNSDYWMLSNYKGKITSFSNEIVIKDIYENVIDEGTHNKLPIEGKLKIYSNSEIDIIHYRNNLVFRSYKIKKQENIIENLRYNDKLVVKIGLKKKLLLEYEELKEANSFDDNEIYNRLKKLNGIYEPVDIYTRAFLNKLKNYPKTYCLIRLYISTNKMPLGAKKVIKQLYLK